jgi:hypothetical protein
MGVLLSVAHLPHTFSSADLRQVTERHAPVVKCWVVKQPGGGCLGFGYVEVPTSADVESLMKGLSGVILDSKPVSVSILDTA